MHNSRERSREQIERLRRNYPKGTKVVLGYMEGEPRMPPGLKGEVYAVDDIGQIHVHWENGSGLALDPDVDEFRRDGAVKNKDRGEPQR